MKVILISDEKGLEVGQTYKIKEVRRSATTFMYRVQLPDGGYKWIESKKFKYPMKWLK